MSRWLQAARAALPPPTIPTKGDRTPTEPGLPALNPVLSGSVGFVGGGIALDSEPDTSTRAAIIGALAAGLKTPGSIATAAKFGATVTRNLTGWPKRALSQCNPIARRACRPRLGPLMDDNGVGHQKPR